MRYLSLGLPCSSEDGVQDEAGDIGSRMEEGECESGDKAESPKADAETRLREN